MIMTVTRDYSGVVRAIAAVAGLAGVLRVMVVMGSKASFPDVDSGS